ncbi:MAG: copper-binding protein [Candidatus Omnitrophica bacterium]|nr:copper-binding protein [Candidatus Omnitrophota bacterium]
MVKHSSWVLGVFLVFTSLSVQAAEQVIRRFEGKGEVTSADPLFSRVTIKHGAMKGFAEERETEFFVDSAGLLKDIHRYDLVEFTVADRKGEVLVEKIKKVGEASPPPGKIEIGKAVRDVVVATGEVAKGIASPIPPVQEMVSGAAGAASETTAVLNEASIPEPKQEF